MAYCKTCGEKFSDSDKFCIHCGTKIDSVNESIEILTEKEKTIPSNQMNISSINNPKMMSNEMSGKSVIGEKKTNKTKARKTIYISLFSIVVVVLIIFLFLKSGKSQYEVKLPSLISQTDSLNYAFGLANGDGIKSLYLSNKDSVDRNINTLLQSMDNSFEGKSNNSVQKSVLSDLGLKIANTFREQEKSGLMGESSIKVKIPLIKQGLVNGLKGFNQGMTPNEAKFYIQETMMKIQELRMSK